MSVNFCHGVFSLLYTHDNVAMQNLI